MFASKTLYFALLAFRLYSAFLPGYIHPDEFFQGPEIMAGDILGAQTSRTWEFDQNFPCRSILPIYLFSGIPIHIVKLLSSFTANSVAHNSIFQASFIFFSVRFYSFLVSLIFDYSIFKIMTFAKKPQGFRRKILVLLSVSFPIAIFMNRPFSNSAETILLVLVLVFSSHIEYIYTNSTPTTNIKTIQQMAAHHQSMKQTRDATIIAKPTIARSTSLDYSFLIPRFAFLGFLFGIGTFTRLTFVAFALPPALSISLLSLKLLHRNKTLLVSCFLAALVSLVITISTCILVDMIYFQKITLPILPSQVLPNILNTVYNNYKYNSDASNLKLHGIHPRYLHLLVNVPLFFGPTLYILYRSVTDFYNLHNKLRFIEPSLSSDLKKSQRSRSTHPSSSNPFEYTAMAGLMSAVFGLSALSTVPHQEPRFILPMIAGVFTFFSLSNVKISVWSWASLVVFNFCLWAIFGVFHQSGVLKSIWKLNNESHQIQAAFSHGKYYISRDSAHIVVSLGADSTLSNQYYDRERFNTQNLNQNQDRVTNNHRISNEIKLITDVYFIYAFMPPLHLIENKQNKNSKMNVMTTRGLKIDQIRKILKLSTKSAPETHAFSNNNNGKDDIYDSRKSTTNTATFEKSSNSVYKRTLVVVPEIYDAEYFSNESISESPTFRFKELYTFPFHLDFDDIAYHLNHQFRNLTLKCYQLLT